MFSLFDYRVQEVAVSENKF